MFDDQTTPRSPFRLRLFALFQPSRSPAPPSPPLFVSPALLSKQVDRTTLLFKIYDSEFWGKNTR
jgi:hypothetical protein